MASKELDTIIKEYAPRLRRYVRARVSNADDADDIVQDTFYQLLRTIGIMENPIGHITSWLYTVAHNLVVNHGKKHREIAAADMGAAGEDFMSELQEIMAAPSDESAEMLMLRSMVWDELHKALSELPPEQRQAIEMTEVQGLSVKEAALMLGVPLGTFLSRKHYAVVHIRKRLRTLYDELTLR